MKKRIAILTGAVVFFFTFNAGVCNKNDVPAPPPSVKNCKVITIKDNFTDMVKATYNSNGTIATVIFDDGVDQETRTYTYTGNTVKVLIHAAPNPQILKTITLNADGLPVKIVEVIDLGGITEQIITEFEYNGKQVTKKTLIDAVLNNVINVTNYTWQNGNLKSESVEGGETTVYEYYTDRNYLSGDYMSVRHLIVPLGMNLGTSYVYYPFIVNKNPVKSAMQGNVQVLLIDYALDANGNIKQWLMGANGTPGDTIVQQCN